jgi:hypothetical protein
MLGSGCGTDHLRQLRNVAAVHIPDVVGQVRQDLGDGRVHLLASCAAVRSNDGADSSGGGAEGLSRRIGDVPGLAVVGCCDNLGGVLEATSDLAGGREVGRFLEAFGSPTITDTNPLQGFVQAVERVAWSGPVRRYRHARTRPKHERDRGSHGCHAMT